MWEEAEVSVVVSVCWIKEGEAGSWRHLVAQNDAWFRPRMFRSFHMLSRVFTEHTFIELL